MIYQIISPSYATIYGDNYKEAIKNYVKMNHNLSMSRIIFRDQQANHYRAKVNYYSTLQQNKVGINFYPYTTPIRTGPIVPFPIVNQIVPIAPFASPIIPIAPFTNPFVPIAPIVSPIIGYPPYIPRPIIRNSPLGVNPPFIQSPIIPIVPIIGPIYNS
jgi:hypothetical protein